MDKNIVITRSLGAWFVYRSGAIRHETLIGIYRTKRDAMRAAELA